MEAIILAGGLGKRLQGIVNDVPKPMADICGRPFLSYLIDNLLGQGISKILLSVGYKYETIKKYFGLEYKDLDIEYAIENEPLGTGGAIMKAIELVNGESSIILNGDTFFDVDLKKIAEFHSKQDSNVTIAVKSMHSFDRYGSVAIRGTRITGFEEKSFKKFGYINGGIYVVNKNILKFLKKNRSPFSFEVDFLFKNAAKIPFFAFISDGYFIDIGVPDDYMRAQKELNQIVIGKFF